MTLYPDWRIGPDPLKCISCTATEAACDNRQMFSGRHCCEACEHEPPPAQGVDPVTNATPGSHVASVADPFYHPSAGGSHPYTPPDRKETP